MIVFRDLQAQIAANHKGVQLINARSSFLHLICRENDINTEPLSPFSSFTFHLAPSTFAILPVPTTFYLTVIKEWSLETVQKYMGFINLNAELAVRSLLKDAVIKAGSNRLHALDHMDDGTAIELTIDIDPETGSAVFDFEGTGYESWSSLNAPVAVCSSAVIYCLRALCGSEIPLNAGCLAPITRSFLALFILKMRADI